jgi:multisubunit Na+/H+ antiporter MnhB subunit
MNVIVKTVSRILFPFILIMGSYVAFYAHISPGGAFPAGAIIATGFALLVIVFTEGDVEHKLTSTELIDLKSVAGVLLIILILSLGTVFREGLLSTQSSLQLWGGGFTMISNIGGMFMVVTAIVLIIYSIVRE